jgi:trimeric autotransporter adhesin
LEHRITNAVSLSGFYLFNKTQEPCSNYFGSADQNEPNRFADPDDYYLVRKPQILALNNTWVLSNTSVLALRFGMTDFPDDNTLSADFDPRTLGFSQTFQNQIKVDKFPQVRIRGYDGEGRTMGAINPTKIDWKSTSANAVLSKLVASHTFKGGIDWRKICVDTYIPGDGAGYFDFDKDMTSSNGGTGSTTDGNAFASFLLGYPSSLSTRETRLSVSTPLNVFTNYVGGFIQDDWRVNGKLTVNYGLRLEHERGLSEENNNFTVGWDPKMTSVLSSITVPADPLSGAPARAVSGGLMYAGVDGNNTYQGNAPALKWSPRVGAAYTLDSKTVIRGGYGLYWAPLNFAVPSTASNNYGQVGYSQNTVLTSSRSNPTSLSNPFPNGVAQPTGNSLGALTNLNSNISYVDQNRTAPRIQQYSVDVQREFGNSWALALTYMGARGDDLTLGGANDDIGININQLDPKYLALGKTALEEQLPNPFLGNPNVPLSLSTPATLSRARLLLPHPQYNQINARQVTEGYSRYQAGVIELTRRMTHGFGGRFNYTYSVLKDNQFGETNFYSSVSPALAVNNYNYVASMPACAGGQAFTTACYDPSSEYGYGIVDSPHRFNIVPVYELPFGTGKKWAQGPTEDRIFGGWTISAVLSFQSGFPINIQQGADAVLGGQNTNRPNLSGADLATSGDFYDRLASADHPAATWMNPAGFILAPFGVFGNAPRTITDVRTPSQRNIDAAIIKNVRLAGTKTVTFRMEIINLLNRPNVRNMQGTNVFGNANFGRTSTQAGYMRLLQFTGRFSF